MGIVWHKGKTDREKRSHLNGHGASLIWLTGLSGAGKSTTAFALDEFLYHKGIRSYVLDGDNIRHGLNRDLGFSPQDRSENIRRVAEVGKLLVDAGIVTITSLISPYRKDRDLARALFDPGHFVEVYVKCPLSVCEERDPKGLYQKARDGKILEFTGISSPYEEPLAPEIVLKTDRLNSQDAVETIWKYLVQEKICREPH